MKVEFALIATVIEGEKLRTFKAKTLFRHKPVRVMQIHNNPFIINNLLI